MRSFAELQKQFGDAMATCLQKTKREMQAKRKPTEPMYVMDHPDFPGNAEPILHLVEVCRFKQYLLHVSP